MAMDSVNQQQPLGPVYSIAARPVTESSDARRYRRNGVYDRVLLDMFYQTDVVRTYCIPGGVQSYLSGKR